MLLEQYVIENHSDALQKILESERNNLLPELSEFEKAIIFAYTDISKNQHQPLNEMLWESQGNEISDFGIFLDFSLSKLSSFKGLVYRGVKVGNCDISRYVKAIEDKTILTEYNFISATHSQIIARGFGNILFRIYSKNAKSIEVISKFAKEKELIFRRNTKFRVLFVSNNGIYTTITLKEF
jgi:NAD:arginine ADP-ribosyltransferase